MSPIVKILNEADGIKVHTLDNREYLLKDNKVVSAVARRLAVNCLGVVRIGTVSIGVGNANQAGADGKSVVFMVRE
jgi:hypothetical protein